MESQVSRCGASRKQIAYADLISLPAMKVPSLGQYVVCNASVRMCQRNPKNLEEFEITSHPVAPRFAIRYAMTIT